MPSRTLALVQLDSSARSGIESGSGKIFLKKCFGYDQDENGELIINDDEAQIVRLIFDLYLKGYCILAIIRELHHQELKSPTGKDQWSKRTMDTMLANEKYTGSVVKVRCPLPFQVSCLATCRLQDKDDQHA